MATKEKMTIHRGLAELKLIDAKIDKAITAIEPAGVMKPEKKKVNQHYDHDEFVKDAQSKYDSVEALITRKAKIKSAITLTNATTAIEVGGKKMTIAEAINHKSIIEARKKLHDTLIKKHRSAKANAESHNSTVEANALRLAEAALGRDGVKLSDKDAVAVTEPYMKANEVVLVDPLNIEKLTTDMESEILTFEAEIDAILSEVNATTMIEF